MNIKTGLMILGTLYACTAVADTAPSAPKKENECVYSDQILGWNVLDSRHVLIWAPTYKEAHLLTLIAPLNDTGVTMSLAFVDRDHKGMICGHSSDAVSVPDSDIHTIPSIISGMHRVDAAELQQLSEKYKINLAPKKKQNKSASSSSSTSSDSANTGK